MGSGWFVITRAPELNPVTGSVPPTGWFIIARAPELIPVTGLFIITRAPELTLGIGGFATLGAGGFTGKLGKLPAALALSAPTTTAQRVTETLNSFVALILSSIA